MNRCTLGLLPVQVVVYICWVAIMDEAAERRKRLKSMRDAVQASPSSSNGRAPPGAGSAQRAHACALAWSRGGPLVDALGLRQNSLTGAPRMQRHQLASKRALSTRLLRQSHAHRSQRPVSRFTGKCKTTAAVWVT